MRVEVTRQFEIAAAHYQPDYDGKCKNMHGHNYIVELTAVGDTEMDLDGNGMLVDFFDMKADLEAIVGVFDHTVLNEGVPFPPSTELMAQEWLNNLREHSTFYKKLKVWENSRSSATVYSNDYLAETR